MITRKQVVKGTQVRFVEGTKPVSMAMKYLMEEPEIRIRESHVYNDSYGDWIWVEGGFNSHSAYLKELEIVPISN
jgi:hypothetical protein